MEKLFRNIGLGLFFLLFVNQCIAKYKNVRTILNFGNGWKFQLGNVTGAEIPAFDDSSLRKLNVPHDWSIEGEFKEDNLATPEGGALPCGIGWYRKSFKISSVDLKRSVFIDFDGVYQNSEVLINGHSVGKRFYGFSSFRYELTSYLLAGESGNVIAVKVDNSAQPNSRFYTGSGIFRNLWLVKTGNTYIEQWGIFITTPEITDLQAKVKVVIRIKSQLKNDQKLVLKTVILDPERNEVVTGKVPINEIKDSVSGTTFDFTVKNPALWNLEAPKLYSAVSHVFVDGELVDNCTTPFGIRNFEFTVDKGFFLNGKNLKINGVCTHHDLGCLGSAINKRALERQLEILKDMGCNAIRQSCPPAPELLDLADKMGFLILDEPFDMWKKPKRKFDYSTVWDTEHKRDLTCSSYDNCSTAWGSTHEETWKEIKKYDFLSGQFILSGFDYLGEPTPYRWPARSSYFGIMDLAGFPKEVYYMYQSEWTKKNVLHLFPHWNWEMGQTIDIWEYSNAEEVELFLNDKSLGVKKKIGDDLHVMWRVPFTPGTLRAVSRTAGRNVLVREVKTAGTPARLLVKPDRSEIKADTFDLSFVTVDIVDKNGVIVPEADNLVKFKSAGAGAIIGVDNGNPVSHESFKAPQRKAFHGKCLVVIQSGKNQELSN